MDAPYPELEIGLHRVQADAYQVELRFLDPASDAEIAPRMDTEETRLRTWTGEGGLSTWDLNLDTDWPMDKWSLRVEAETATTLTPTGELKGLSPADWTRKRFCEYDAIRHDLKRVSAAEWAESERRCKALDQPEQPRAPPPTMSATRNTDGR